MRGDVLARFAKSRQYWPLFGLLALLVLLPSRSVADEPIPPGVSGFPPGYFLPCSEAPKAAVLTVPAPFDRFMRVLCTKAGHALAPPPGFHWVFANGMSLWLSSLSPHSGLTGQDAYFTRLEASPLTDAEAAAFRLRAAAIVNTPDILQGEIIRLDVDTSTGERRQEYMFVSRGAGGAVSRAWGIECFHDCDPMEKQPWAYVVRPDQPAGSTHGQ